MKNKNSIAIGLSLLTLFTLSGCVTKTINSTTPYINRNIPIQNANEREDKIDKKAKLPISAQVCVGDNCKASILKSKRCKKPFKFIANNRFKKEDKYIPVIESIYNENVSESLTDTSTPQYNTYIPNDPYVSYNEPKIYPKIEQFSKKTSIQVGAFRRYAGAKIYARRYGLLSHQYKTVIKKDIKDNKPIYRVRIEGFENEHKAKAFISRYSLNGAFLVRR